MRRAPAGFLGLTAALAMSMGAGCRKPVADSPQYEQAFDLYTQLYAAKLDDAYGDPAMSRVLTLLSQVDPASSRAAEASELKSKVEQGQADWQKRQARVVALEQAASAPVNWPAGPAPAVASPMPAPATAAAGPSLGMTRDDFLAKFASCFDLKGLYEQGGSHGEAYGMKAACTARYPALQGNLVVLLDNRVSRLVPLSQVTASTPTSRAAAAPIVPRPASPPPPPAPKVVHWMPGAPRPAGP